jgi:hypothetical protein
MRPDFDGKREYFQDEWYHEPGETPIRLSKWTVTHGDTLFSLWSEWVIHGKILFYSVYGQNGSYMVKYYCLKQTSVGGGIKNNVHQIVWCEYQATRVLIHSHTVSQTRNKKVPAREKDGSRCLLMCSEVCKTCGAWWDLHTHLFPWTM